ncbi:MAG TPA: T9SS type A sorting domain-containing protein [Flavobacteriales bacterium]|nr:T9SS type A sorting domain-containing protein [Flavobacteriales bacterium]
MKHVFLFLAISVSQILLAQPDFTRSDMPDIGDHDTVMFLNYIAIDNNLETETGNNYTWDFTFLPFATYPNFIKQDSFRVKTHTLSQSFPDATIEEYIYDGTAGDLNLFSYSNDTLMVHRLGGVVAGLSNFPAMASMAFPYSYNETSEVNAYFHSGSIVAGERRTTVTYDGFGTLQMPFGKTYSNVFRITKIERDTSYITNTTLTSTRYMWYKQGGQVPLLVLTYSGSLNLFFVLGSKSNATSLGLNPVNELSADIRILPNPSHGIFQIQTNDFQSDKLEVFTVLGKKIYSGKSEKQLDLSGFPEGVYFVSISKGAKIITKKIVMN